MQADGVIVVQHRGAEPTARALTDQELTDLRQQILEADIPSLTGDYRVAGADMFQYTLTMGGSTFTADDPAVPPAVQPLITTLSTYASSSGA